MSSGNVQIVRAIYSAFERRDVAAVLSLIAPDIQLVQSSELPWGGEFSGPAGLQKFLGTLTQQVDSRVEVERFVDAGESVVAIGCTRGTVRSNGKTFDVPVVHVWHVRNGKAVRFEPHIENSLMLAALNG